MTRLRRRIAMLNVVASAIILAGCFGGAARRDAIAQRQIVNALVRERDSVAVKMLALEERIAELTAATDSARRNAIRLEEALRDRDEQLRAARLELQRLKEIDLKSPRRPPTSRPLD